MESKNGFVSKEEAAADMEKINRYTRRELTPADVYTFSLVLCDNETDRQYERFSIDALKKLKELFLGKTCILDHERKSQNQTARIFDTQVEEVPSRRTSAGEPYTRLTARAYLPRTQRNSEIIELIESGILKEVSISCSVNKKLCSVCGQESCAHVPGEVYSGSTCVKILTDPADAYECSFVAVPAQREAGVRKSLKFSDSVEKKLCEVTPSGLTLSREEAMELRSRLTALSESASFGESMREALIEKTLGFISLSDPDFPRDILKTAFSALSGEELSLLSRAVEKSLGKRIPISPQLSSGKRDRSSPRNAVFKI